MADVVLEPSASSMATPVGMRAMVFRSSLLGYFFFVDSDGDLKYVKTQDGGATWGVPTDIYVGTVVGFCTWYDRWTPTITGSLIHIWYAESSTDNLYYRTLDADDVISAPQTVLDGDSYSANINTCISGATMRGGNLYVAISTTSSSWRGLFRSIDAGVTWTARNTGTPIENTPDRFMLFPGNEADANDCWMLYEDASASALTLKMHDDSAATTSESATIATVTQNDTTHGVEQFAFSGSIRHSDGHLIASVVTEYDTATADHRVFDINGTASITEKTAIATNKSDHYYPSMFINQLNNHIYVAYIGKREGIETLGISATPSYVKSTDGGVTWSP